MNYRVFMMDAGLILLIKKIIGASIGSSIAVVFKPDGDTKAQLWKRFWIGVVIGSIACPILMDWFGWPTTTEYVISAASLGGVTGVLALQLLFSNATRDLIDAGIKKGVGKE